MTLIILPKYQIHRFSYIYGKLKLSFPNISVNYPN